MSSAARPASNSSHSHSHGHGSARLHPQINQILSLPPLLLTRLARTGDAKEQAQLASHSGLQADVLRHMAASPPPPTASPDAFVPAALPFLLHTKFSPHTSGIAAVAGRGDPQRPTPFEPVYASVDLWAQEQAKLLANSAAANSNDLQLVASQLKAWAHSREEHEVDTTIQKARSVAIDKAVQAAMQRKNIHDATRNSALPAHGPQDYPPVDYKSYQAYYSQELDRQAQGYYPTLHKKALQELSSASHLAPQAKLVRASAVAALASNVLAANDMTSAAEHSLASLHHHHQGNGNGSLAPPGGSSSSADRAYSPSQPIQPGMTDASYLTNDLGSASAALAPVGDNRIVNMVRNAEASGCTAESRNYMLHFAHTAYSTSMPIDLLPLLHLLDRLHPHHCPTLLLLSCVYYSRGSRRLHELKAAGMASESDPVMLHNFEASLMMNYKILEIDPEYVEAMSNIGTTLRALGQAASAEKWWKRAIEARPTYFDAIENLLGVLVMPPSPGAQYQARVPEAIQLCETVEKHIFGEPADRRPVALPAHLPANHIHRLQNMLFAKGNLHASQRQDVRALRDYERAIEILLATDAPSSSSPSAPPQTDGTSHTQHGHDSNADVAKKPVSIKELVEAVMLAGLWLMSCENPQSPHTKEFQKELAEAGFWPASTNTLDMLTLVHARGAHVKSILTKVWGTPWPNVLIKPEVIPQVRMLVFGSRNGGHVPALSNTLMLPTGQEDPNSLRHQTTSQTAQTSSTVLLTIAKHYQDAISYPQSPVALAMHKDGMPPSMAAVLPLYYLALGLHPSASTYNNLGILLSTLSVQTIVDTSQGLRMMNGQALAMEYYKVGLEHDSKHPHLYTNLGSLLKDMGHLPMAVQMYERAVQYNPTFDVALTNLANAIKDMGHVEDSVQWYKKAVEQNPKFPEAICGLVNALNGICDWSNRGALDLQGDPRGVGPNNQILRLDRHPDREILTKGWIPQVSALVSEQLESGCNLGQGSIVSSGGIDKWLIAIHTALSSHDSSSQHIKVAEHWTRAFQAIVSQPTVKPALNEGGFLIRVVELLMRRIQRRWYKDTYGHTVQTSEQLPGPSTESWERYQRPRLPANLPTPTVPTVLPFHTFTYPLSARQIRLISHRNALRVSQTTLTQPWLPPHVFPPPPPPSPKIKIGYVSSDFNNHPLAHLMQSVFGMHDLSRFDIYCYATTPSDLSEYRTKIEHETQHFIDASMWSTEQVIRQILADGIHILVNMNGYTKGARNEIFAARPCPIQIHQLMGFAGTLASGWCDWVIADTTIIPPETVSSEVWRDRRKKGQSSVATTLPGLLDPEEKDEDWMYTEKMVYLPNTYFVTDHKQGFRDVPTSGPMDREAAWLMEEQRRWRMRKELFPTLPDNCVIFCCLNQLYKIDPIVLQTWINILQKVPNSILWLLRFPAAGEAYIRRTAAQWGGPQIADRIYFTDVAPKNIHIARGRIADLFLDSIEVGGHTTSADVLWSGTPVITFPKYKQKLCSRVAASIAQATKLGRIMVADSLAAYEERAIALANDLRYDGSGQGTGTLHTMRKTLFQTRDEIPLFDTLKWTRDVEKAYVEIWRRWVDGTEFEDSEEFANSQGPVQESGCIWIE